jgi:DNA repair exonuclease SbcCD nuclease subunit
MSYRALFISDLHLSNRLPHAKADVGGVTDRLRDQLELWKRVKKSIDEFRAQDLFVLGDVFDKSLVDAITLKEAVAAIVSTQVPVYILAGNHDAINTRGGRFTVEVFGELGNDRVHYLKTGVPISPTDWLTFHPIEYSTQERAREYLSAVTTDHRKIDVGLMHHSILGCEHEGWVCDDGLTPEEACAPFDWVFSGHFHTTQKFGDRGMYLGAPMHHRFDDAGRKAGYWGVEFDEHGERKLKFFDGGAPHFFEYDWPLPKEAGKLPRPSDYVRIKCTSTIARWQTLKTRVIETVDGLTKAGFRASFQHKPLYHHTTRLEKKGEPTALRPELMMRSYLRSSNVDKSGLDSKRLAQIGAEALSAAKASMRGS